VELIKGGKGKEEFKPEGKKMCCLKKMVKKNRKESRVSK
jgi:hypothetical protein